VTRKRDMCRPYPPQFVSAETAAYLLDISRTTFDDYVRRGILPKSIDVGSLPRWSWNELEAFIHARNGLASNGTFGAPSGPNEDDRYQRGIERVAAAEG
jgi:predicted DNA-binding transcriptional regulator AlpA